MLDFSCNRIDLCEIHFTWMLAKVFIKCVAQFLFGIEDGLFQFLQFLNTLFFAFENAGMHLDIVADFAFYVSIPLGFGVLASHNTLPALVLVASFVLTGVSFLAFATIAATRGESTQAHGQKSFFYSTGLAEGTETIAVFIAMCLFPAYFGLIAYTYAGLCVLTVFQRSALAVTTFR